MLTQQCLAALVSGAATLEFGENNTPRQSCDLAFVAEGHAMDTDTCLLRLRLQKEKLEERMEAIREQDRRCPPLRRPLTISSASDGDQLRKQIGFLKAWLGAFK